MDINLETDADNTWCPGCGNFGISAVLKSTIKEMIEEGTDKKDIVLASGIGCGSKIIDYLNINTFSSLHGRPVAAAEGVKLGNPNLEGNNFYWRWWCLQRRDFPFGACC